MFTKEDFEEKELRRPENAESWIKRLKACQHLEELDGLLFNAFDSRECDPLVARVILTISGVRTRSETHSKLVTTARNVLMKFLKKPNREKNGWTSDQNRDAQAPWFDTVRKDPSLFPLLVKTLDAIYEDRLPNSHKELVREFVDTCLKYHGYRLYGDHDMDATDTEMMEIINGSMNDLIHMIFGCHLEAHLKLHPKPPETKEWRDRNSAILKALEHMVFSAKPVTKDARMKLMHPDNDRDWSNLLLTYYIRRRHVITTEENPRLMKTIEEGQMLVNRLELQKATGDFSEEMADRLTEAETKVEERIKELQALRAELEGLP